MEACRKLLMLTELYQQTTQMKLQYQRGTTSVEVGFLQVYKRVKSVALSSPNKQPQSWATVLQLGRDDNIVFSSGYNDYLFFKNTKVVFNMQWLRYTPHMTPTVKLYKLHKVEFLAWN